jgi:hypothetical protein
MTLCLNFIFTSFMAKDHKEPKRLCRCGCDKWLSARAERRHRDGQVPPRIAAVQKSQSKVAAELGHLPQSINLKTVTSTAASARTLSHVNTSGHRQDDIGMDENIDRVPSPMDFSLDDAAILQDAELGVAVPDEIVMTASTESATPALNSSVDNARATVWSEWRPQREKVSEDEEDENSADSGHENSDDELVGLVMPEDDDDSEPDSQSVEDRIEAEWEKEWTEMGVFHFLCICGCFLGSNFS